MARVLFIIAQKNFRDEELTVPLEILRNSGHICSIASIKKDKCKGMLGLEVNADIAVKDVIVNNFDAIVIIGGSGSPELANHNEVLDILREAKKNKKIIAAICFGPIVLAKAGLLKGKKTTVFMTDFAIKIINDSGAILVNEGIVVDGYLITAEGPRYSKEFGKKILELLI